MTPDPTPPIPADLLHAAAWQLWQLLADGVSRERVIAIGRWRGSWSAEDVTAVQQRMTPEPPPEKRTRYPKAECGTPGGRQRHKRRKESVCDPCREAWNRYQSEWRSGRSA